jgi:predicted ATPase
VKPVIKSIKFKRDFRSFKKDAEFQFKPGVNVLVGDQGAGKSTMIELLRSKLEPKTFGESDSSYRAKSIEAHDKIDDLVEVTTDKKKKVVAFDFERESARDMSQLLHDMLDVQLFAMKASHGQGNLASLNSLIEKIAKDRDAVDVILLDEPDSALSPRNCYGLVGILHGLASKWNKQVIVSAHNPIVIHGRHPLIQKDPFWTEVLSLEEKKWMPSDIFMLLQLSPVERKPREKAQEKGKKTT